MFLKILENEIWQFGRNFPLVTFGTERVNEPGVRDHIDFGTKSERLCVHILFQGDTVFSLALRLYDSLMTLFVVYTYEFSNLDVPSLANLQRKIFCILSITCEEYRGSFIEPFNRWQST